MASGEMTGFIRVDHDWQEDEWWSAVRCRLGRFGAHSRVAPGLYALSRPDDASSVLVTASYRLSFDLLRKDLRGLSCWILVLDTRGLGVGCAAAGGLFSTDEVVTRVKASRLERVVEHRTLILPRLAAGSVDPEQVRRGTGFEVHFGPGRSSDVASHIRRAPAEASPPGVEDFSVLDRLALTPVEVGLSLTRWFPVFAFAALILAGLGPEGVGLGRALSGAWPLLLLGLTSVVCGSLFAPVFPTFGLPVPYFVRGWALGAAGTAVLLGGIGLRSFMDPSLLLACGAFFPAASAFHAVRFTAAAPAAAGPLLRRETRAFLPFGVAAGILTCVGIVFWKLAAWGLPG